MISRLKEINALASSYSREAKLLSSFFQRCFCRSVRRFLCAARADLDWRRTAVDWTLMAFILVYLHGKREASLSNQMRQTKAMSRQYALKWWSERDLEPPTVDPVEFLETRVRWRYRKGQPEISAGSRVYLGDSTSMLGRIHRFGFGIRIQICPECLQIIKLLDCD